MSNEGTRSVKLAEDVTEDASKFDAIANKLEGAFEETLGLDDYNEDDPTQEPEEELEEEEEEEEEED